MSRPPGVRVVLALARAQLRLELRSFESLPAMCCSRSAPSSSSLRLNRPAERDLASGVLWVTLLLAALLAINRIYVADAEQGGFDAFVMSRAPREALLYASCSCSSPTWRSSSWSSFPAFALLLLEPSVWQAFPGLLGPLALGDLGVAVIGALVGALAVRTRCATCSAAHVAAAARAGAALRRALERAALRLPACGRRRAALATRSRAL